MYYHDRFQAANSEDTFKLLKCLLGKNQTTALPSAPSSQHLADSFVPFFQDKVLTIRSSLDSIQIENDDHQEVISTMPPQLSDFSSLSQDMVLKIINGCAPKTCALSMPYL